MKNLALGLSQEALNVKMAKLWVNIVRIQAILAKFGKILVNFKSFLKPVLGLKFDDILRIPYNDKASNGNNGRNGRA